MKPEEPVGFSVIADRSGYGDSGLLPPPQLIVLREQLMLLSGSCDRVVINHGTGVDRTVQALNPPRGTCLMVMIGEPTAQTDAYAFIEVTLTELRNTFIRVLVNLKGEGEDSRFRPTFPVSR